MFRSEARSVVAMAISVCLFATSCVEGGVTNSTGTGNSTAAATQPPSVPASSVAGFIVLLCVLVAAVCVTVVTCCISGVWKALSKNGASRSHTQSQVEAPNTDNLIPRPPSQCAVTSPTVKRPETHNNIYTLHSLSHQHTRPHVSNAPVHNGHTRKYSLSTPKPVVLTQAMFPPIGTRAYSFRDKSASSHSSDSAFIQYGAHNCRNVAVAAVTTEPRAPSPPRPKEEECTRDTPV